MLSALLLMFSRESRTSLGEPVEPDVLSSSARSGSQLVVGPVHDVDPVAPGDDVGPVRREEVVAQAVLAGEQHRMVGLERGEVGDHRLDVVAALEQDQPAGGPQLRHPVAHPHREVDMGQAGVG